jgi:hypothetical protein
MREFLSGWFLILIARFVLGMVFVVAAVPKIADPATFASAVEAYELLPFPAVNAAAILIPWLELACGLFLVAGFNTRGAAALLGALLVFFIGAIMLAILRGLSINCGCFGGADAAVGWGKVLEDVALLLPAGLIFFFGGNREEPPAGETGERGTWGGDRGV